ncbi:MAG: hypothetical protein RL220_1603 [Bacteroidota bacterium]
MKARRLTPNEYPAFGSLAEQCDSVFCSDLFLSSFDQNTVVRFGIFDDKDVMMGGFVLMITRLRGIQALINPTYAPHCGLFTTGDHEGHGFRKNQFHKDVLTAVAEALASESVRIISASLPVYYTDAQPFLWRKFRIQTKFTYRLDLTQSEEEILNGYDPKLRSVIRKYTSGEIKVDSNLDAQRLITVIGDLNKTKGIRKRDTITESIAENYLTQQRGKSIAAIIRQDNDWASVAFCIRGNNECYYLLGTVNKAVKLNGASTLCLHHCISTARQSGVKVFDFEGSSIPGVEAFFRSFGGELIPYFNISRCPLILRPFLKN